LDSVFTHDNPSSRRGSIELSAAAPSQFIPQTHPFLARRLPRANRSTPNEQYLQFVAEVVNSAPLPHTRDRPSWISKFFDLDNFLIIEFATRMKGSVQIPRSDGGHRVSELDHLGAFALPCVSSTISATDESDLPIPRCGC